MSNYRRIESIARSMGIYHDCTTRQIINCDTQEFTIDFLTKSK